MATPSLRWTLAWLGLAVALIGARPARADVFDDNPATAARRAGELYVFARAADGAIYERHRTDGLWSDWSSLGGNLTSGPAAIAYGPDIMVFARGTDGQVYQRTLDGDEKWGDWTGLGGYATSAPAASVRHGSSGYIDLAVRGGDNTIWQRTWTPTGGWTGSVSLGGNLTSAPTLNSQGADILNVFARGVDGQVYQRAYNGSAWSEWGALGGGILGAPAAVTRADPYVNVYARGAANATYARGWNGAAWSAWLLLDDTPIDSSPAGAGDGPDHEWIVARRGNALLLKEWTPSTGWGAWQDTGAIALPAPPPAPAPAPVTLPDGAVDLQTGLRCTPAGGRLRVSLAVKKPKGKAKPRVTKIVFFTKGKGRRVQVDSKAPFQVHIRINRPAGSKGRVYARVYYKRTARGKVHRKVVSRRYTVCR